MFSTGHYDIFISYKRKSLPTANNLYYRLTTRGYSTFFDLEEMRKDSFDIQLLNYIENAKDVFMILEDGSLDACKGVDWEKDWFCKEIAYALKMGKNIIPILIGGFKMPDESFFPNELKDLSKKNAPEFSFSFFEEYLNKLINKGYITSEAHANNVTSSVFKFYSNENCQVFKEGKLVCNLEGMSEEPYYLPVPRKGDYRFKIVNRSTNKSQVLIVGIDAVEEKNIEIKWKRGLPVKNLFQGKRKGCSITICVLLLFIVVFIPLNLRRISIGNTSLVPSPPDICSTDTVCTPVNLGLPSGTLWGDRNVGAESPIDFGSLYAWGEIKEKNDYSPQSYVGQLKPSLKISDAKHDAATTELGEEWTLPTEEQFKELITECSWVWKKSDNHYGYEIIGKNGNKIFLPASGWNQSTKVEYRNQYGYYWTSERSTISRFARSLMFPKNGKGFVGNGYLYVGRSIRAVYVNETISE
ncbi:MAG: TIR domain-containing protein [Bacteroidales bacterium]|nr:TIR domain-containing protein [Bacteroidales bacterium]